MLMKNKKFLGIASWTVVISIILGLLIWNIILQKKLNPFSDRCPRGSHLLGTPGTDEWCEGMDAAGNQVKEGTQRQWHPNGRLAFEGGFLHGKRHGHRRSWYESGQKMFEGWRDREEPYGYWINWYENGKKKNEGGFKSGQASGRWVFYDEDGVANAEGACEHGQRVGEWKFRLTSGTFKAQNFDNGKPILSDSQIALQKEAQLTLRQIIADPANFKGKTFSRLLCCEEVSLADYVIESPVYEWNYRTFQQYNSTCHWAWNSDWLDGIKKWSLNTEQSDSIEVRMSQEAAKQFAGIKGFDVNRCKYQIEAALVFRGQISHTRPVMFLKEQRFNDKFKPVSPADDEALRGECLPKDYFE